LRIVCTPSPKDNLGIVLYQAAVMVTAGPDPTV